MDDDEEFEDSSDTPKSEIMDDTQLQVSDFISIFNLSTNLVSGTKHR